MLVLVLSVLVLVLLRHYTCTTIFAVKGDVTDYARLTHTQRFYGIFYFSEGFTLSLQYSVAWSVIGLYFSYIVARLSLNHALHLELKITADATDTTDSCNQQRVSHLMS